MILEKLKTMNRKEKIEFLKDLSTGKRSIRELEPVTCYELVDEEKDLYVDRKTGIIYTHDEVKEKIKNSVHNYKEWNQSHRIPDTYDFKNTLIAYCCLDPNVDEVCLPSCCDNL
jgi:DNA primase catalytic subunit